MDDSRKTTDESRGLGEGAEGEDAALDSQVKSPSTEWRPGPLPGTWIATTPPLLDPLPPTPTPQRATMEILQDFVYAMSCGAAAVFSSLVFLTDLVAIWLQYTDKEIWLKLGAVNVIAVCWLWLCWTWREERIHAPDENTELDT